MPWCQLKLVSTKYLVLGKDLEEFSYTVWRRTKYPYMVGFLFDKIPVMRNVLLGSGSTQLFYLSRRPPPPSGTSWLLDCSVGVSGCLHNNTNDCKQSWTGLHSNLHEFLQNFISHNRDITQLPSAELNCRGWKEFLQTWWLIDGIGMWWGGYWIRSVRFHNSTWKVYWRFLHWYLGQEWGW